MLVPPEFPPKLRRMVEDSTRRLRFPRNAEDYQTEFPVIFAGT